MHHGDYTSVSYTQYPQNPSPIPNSTPNLLDHHPPPPPQPSYASAPPFTAGGAFTPNSDYSAYPSSYAAYPQHSDPVPTSPAPNFQSYNPPAPPLQQPQSSTPFPRFEAHGAYQPPTQPQSFYPPFDQPPSYAPSSNHSPTPNTSYSSIYPSQYNQPSSEHENSYDNNMKFDQSRGYLDETAGRYGSYGSGRGDLGQDYYGKRPERDYGNEGYGDGVYAYQGSKVEPYGARGTAPKSSTWSGFDDFGRPIGYSSEKDRSSSLITKTVRAVPKAEAQQDVKNGVQKFRVKLLAESGGQSTQDVLCQIGLDGIRMLDPSTSRTLRIYPLDTITRCEVFDSSTLAFWSKSTVDIEPRRIRLKSSSYTTNTLLDTVTAATIQFKEMGGRSRAPESHKMAEQPAEKKKGFADWLTAMKPVNEEKDHWVPDEAVTKCTGCGADFSAFNRKHHCRNCGDIFCDKCTQGRVALTADENAPVVRVCERCKGEVSRRLSNAKEAASRPVLQSHEDLAKKLQEEMERNCKSSSGSRSDGSGRRMKEVACPTCTVHLQVQVPSSGSETIECGVCQHAFIVSAH
ncbi:protein FREE1 [Ipomoea triloba]|uniref:protein FREE1 n=1 Tax=Ipomoea triloba TaxID=35885 RepID=UPI00125DD177|nr:protein FREE1 [Ipomoea triloba]